MSFNLDTYQVVPPAEQPVPPPEQAAPAAAPVEQAPPDYNLDTYQAAAPAQEVPPQEQQAAPEQTPAEPAPTGYVPGTNPVLDTGFAIGNQIGNVVEAVGGPDLRQNLSGFAPPIQEVAEANGIGDKIGAALAPWSRPTEQGEAHVVNDVVNKPAPEKYDLTNPSDYPKIAQQFGTEVQDYIQHPEDVLYAVGTDAASSSALGGEQGFRDWVAANPDKVNQEDPDATYQQYLNDIGYTWESGGLGGALKGIGQQALLDPSLIPSIVMTGGATKLGEIAAEGGKVGVAHGIVKGAELANTAIGGPEQLLLEKAPSALGKLVPQGIKKAFDYTPEAARTEQTQVVNEVAQKAAIERDASDLVGTQSLTPPPPAPKTSPRRAAPISSNRTWEIDQNGFTRVDGNAPTALDLQQAAREFKDIHPNTLRGFDDADLMGGTADKQTVMRAALTRGRINAAGEQIPHWLDDVPRQRMVGDPNITPAKRAAGARYINAIKDRINTYGEDEIGYRMRLIAESKYRGKRGSTQPIEITYDNMRRSLADSIKDSNYKGPVNLGPRFIKKNGKWVPDRIIMVNPKGAGPVLNLADFEPDLARWQLLQGSAQSPFRITTPPPQKPATLPVPVNGVQGFNNKFKPEFDGINVPDPHAPILNMPVGRGTLYTTVRDTQDDVHRLMDLIAGSVPPAAPDELQKLTSKYDTLWKAIYNTDADWASLSEHDANLFAGSVAAKEWHDALPKLDPRRKKVNGVLKIARDANDFRSAMGLYNYAKAPRQIVNQYTGNLMTGVITKPQALTRYLNPALARDIYRQAKEMRLENSPNARYKSAFSRSMERMGRAPSTAITDPAKSLSFGGARDGMGPMMTAARKLLAPDWLRDIVSIPDGMWRDSIATSYHAPRIRAMQEQFAKDVPGIVSDFNRRKGALTAPPSEVAKVVKGVIDSHFSREMRYSEVRATDITEALKAKYPHATAETSELINKLGREYATRDNTVYQLTAKEVNRIAFPWVARNIDEALRHVFLYHYWSTRAGGLYLKEFAKNPWMAANFVRLGQAMNEEAETMQYPDWMKGFMRIFGSPAGSILFLDPRSAITTIATFADWQEGIDPGSVGKDITMLGQLRGIAPAFLSPLLDSLAWGFGLYGNDAKAPLDLSGVEGIPKLGIQFLNLANVSGNLPPGMLRDQANNPIILPEAPLSYFTQKLASTLGGIVREDPQPIPNLYASYDSRMQADLLTVLIRDHPDWTEDQITRTQNAMMLAVANGEPASDEFLAAQRMAVGQSLQGPEIEQLPEPLRGLAGGVLRNLSPMQMLDRPEITLAARTKPPVPALGREPMQMPEYEDSYDGRDLSGAIWNTPRMTALGIANEDAFVPADLKAAHDKYKEIAEATNPNGSTVNGVHYSQEQIMSMTDARRYRLARESMKSDGFTMDDWNAATDQVNATIQNNPELAEFRGYKDMLDGLSPEERKSTVDELYRTEPAFKRMMDQSPYEKGSEDWYNKTADWPETFLGSKGVATSNYDPENMPEGMDTSGYGQNELQKIEDYQNNDNSFTSQVQRSVNEYQRAQDLLDQEYPNYGYTVGTGNLPPDVWKHMQKVWEDNEIDTSYITKTSHYGAQYAAWLANNPGLEDTSIQAYLDSQNYDDGSNKFADATLDENGQPVEKPVIDLNGPVNMDWFKQRGYQVGGATSSTANAPLARNDRDVALRSAPNGQQITLLPKNVILRVIETNGDWSHVQAPAGFDGWVPTSMLLVA